MKIHIFAWTHVIENKVARNQEPHLLFIDLKKACDGVPLKNVTINEKHKH